VIGLKFFLISRKCAWRMRSMGINKYVRSELDDDAIVFDNPSFDHSIIGITTDGKAVYDYEKMVTELMNDDDIGEQEAIDWIEYNTLRAIPYAGEMAPVVMFTFKEDVYGQ
jgi:hypothetical protein